MGDNVYRSVFFLDQTTDIALEELVAQCRKGSAVACREVYRLYARPMLNSSMRIVNNLADAEDMVQEAFADAFLHMGRFTFKSSLEAWLRRIVINKSISFLRKKKMNWVNEDIGALPAEDGEAEAEALHRYNVARVTAAINMLPPAHRIVFNLYAIDGLPQEEIATVMHLSHNNVRTIYHRARKKIIELIKNMPNA